MKGAGNGPFLFAGDLMKKIFSLALCSLFIAGPVPASAGNALTDCILEVLQERLEKTIDKDFKDTEYWKDLLTNVANGTPEAVVQQIMEDYDPKSVGKDIGMKLLERLVPEAAGPIGLLLLANDAVYAYTEYMLTFYKDLHFQYFTEEVLKPSKTTRELRANYNKFISEFVDGGGSDRAVKYDDRKAEEEKFHNAFLQAFRLLYRAEQAAANRANAQKLVVKKFKIMRAQAKGDVEVAQANLEAAGQQASPANVRRFVKDADYAAAVREAARKAGQKPAAEKKKEPEAVKPGAAKPDAGNSAVKPATPAQDKPAEKKETKVTVQVLAQPGSGPLGNSLRLLNAGREEEGKTPPDFSAYSSALADASNKLVFGDMAASVYREMEQNISIGAEAGYANCQKDGNGDPCWQAYKRFQADQIQVKENLKGLGEKLSAELETMRKQMTAAPKPSDKLGEMFKTLGEKMGRADKDNSCNLNLSLIDVKKAAERINECKARIGYLASLITEVEAKTKEFQDFAASYDQKLAADYAAYADKLASNYNLAEYAGAGLDSNLLQNLSGASARAQQAAEADTSVIGGGRIVNLRRAISDNTARSREAQGQLELNNAFIALAAPLAAQAESQFKAQSKDGKAVDLETFDGQFYYTNVANFHSLFTSFFSGALTLLSPKISGGDPRETMPYKQGSIRVWDAEKYPFYETVATHESILKDFSERVAALKELGLEARLKTLQDILKKVTPAADKIREMTADAGALMKVFNRAGAVAKKLEAYVRPAQLIMLFYGTEYTLSAEVMQQTLDTYAKEVEEIKATEQNSVEIFKRYMAAPVLMEREPEDLLNARTALNCKKWKCSATVWQAYRTLTDAQDKLSAEKFQLASPVGSLAVNGKGVAQQASYSYEWSDADLAGGEMKITGTLQPAAVGQLASLKLSLDCKAFDIDLPPGPQFSYSFRPRSGQRYCIKVQPVMAGGKPAMAWPAADDYFTIDYMAGNRDEVKAFYDRFKAAYEGRNASQVMALVSGDWTAGDGTELSDLEENLRNNFRLYDEIKYDISGLNVSKGSRGWQACYDVAITSRIFKRSLKHEEKSKVCEDLGEEGGKLKLLRTSSGSYWYVK